MLAGTCGCQLPPAPINAQVGATWSNRRGESASSDTRRAPWETTSGMTGWDAPLYAKQPIASINGQTISRERFFALLMQSSGPALLEQLVILTSAEQLARDKGIQVGQVEIDREYDRALRALFDPLSAVTPSTWNRETSERVLGEILAQRDMSSEQFLLGIRANAHLRALAQDDLHSTEAQLRQEYHRAFGERALVRHIQLPTLAGITRLRERLIAGEDFAELAQAYSANTASATTGGLIKSFCVHDEALPTAFRRTAFDLEPGAVSDAVRTGTWFHLIRLESKEPARPYEEVQREVAKSLRNRLTYPAMGKLREMILNDAELVIDDSILNNAYQARKARALKSRKP